MNDKTERVIKILAVDDNPQNIKVIGSLLREADYTVGFAFNGKQALELLETSGDYDLVLLDVNMPVMNGYETCQRIRENSDFDLLPIIFLTALSDVENIVDGLELGAQDYISKPFNSKELLARVSTHIELKLSREKLAQTNEWLEQKVNERTLDLQRANSKLEKANAELESLDEAKVDFLKIISHEINTPLNGIIGFTRILKEEIKDESFSEMIGFLEESAHRLEDFASLSLLITELRTKRKQIRMEQIMVKELCKDIFNELKLLTKNQPKVDFKIKVEQISADLELFKKSILVILHNSIKFSSEDQKIDLSFYRTEKHIICQIDDYGPGFPEKILKEPYQLFSYGKDYRDEDKGLGLALVKLIMDAHHGYIHLNNRDKGGATVELCLPLSPKLT